MIDSDVMIMCCFSVKIDVVDFEKQALFEMLLVLRQAVRLALHVAVHRLTERRQSKPAKDSASIVKRAKERFRNSESDHSDHQQKSALRSPTKSLSFPPLSDSAQKSARCT